MNSLLLPLFDEVDFEILFFPFCGQVYVEKSILFLPCLGGPCELKVSLVPAGEEERGKGRILT